MKIGKSPESYAQATRVVRFGLPTKYGTICTQITRAQRSPIPSEREITISSTTHITTVAPAPFPMAPAGDEDPIGDTFVSPS